MRTLEGAGPHDKLREFVESVAHQHPPLALDTAAPNVT